MASTTHTARTRDGTNLRIDEAAGQSETTITSSAPAIKITLETKIEAGNQIRETRTEITETKTE